MMHGRNNGKKLMAVSSTGVLGAHNGWGFAKDLRVCLKTGMSSMLCMAGALQGKQSTTEGLRISTRCEIWGDGWAAMQQGVQVAWLMS
jgi:hypothetical protein